MEVSKSISERREGEKEEEEEGEEEEEKMEMFMEMMRKFRSKMHELHQSNCRNKRKRTTPPGRGWEPAFQLEDFTTDIEFRKHAPPPPPPPPQLCNDVVGSAAERSGASCRPNSPPSSPNYLKLRL